MSGGEDGTVHATAVLVGTEGVLIRGGAGTGKSSLALALIAADPSATLLIADDRVHLAAEAGRLVARVPDALAGLLELRFVGIVRMPWRSPAPITAVVDLLPAGECQRLPAPAERRTVIAGVALRRFPLPVGLADAALRLRVALAAPVVD